MPSLTERQDLSNNIYAMVLGVNPDLAPKDADSLAVDLQSFIWNIECLANAASGAINVENITPGFGLLICKTQSWAPVDLATTCPAITEDKQAFLKDVLGKIAQELLPDPDEQTYQHFETSDGLVCALYRMQHQEVILASAGVDDVITTPMFSSTSVH